MTKIASTPLLLELLPLCLHWSFQTSMTIVVDLIFIYTIAQLIIIFFIWLYCVHVLRKCMVYVCMDKSLRKVFLIFIKIQQLQALVINYIYPRYSYQNLENIRMNNILVSISFCITIAVIKHLITKQCEIVSTLIHIMPGTINANDLGRVVHVDFDYLYKANDGNSVKITEGEEFILIKKSNDDWWQVVKQGNCIRLFAS